MKNNNILTKFFRCFGVFVCSIVLCVGGLTACGGLSSSSTSFESYETGSGFEDVSVTPEHSDSSATEDSSSSVEEDSSSSIQPEGEISAGDPNPEYGNGDMPF